MINYKTSPGRVILNKETLDIVDRLPAEYYDNEQAYLDEIYGENAPNYAVQYTESGRFKAWHDENGIAIFEELGETKHDKKVKAEKAMRDMNVNLFELLDDIITSNDLTLSNNFKGELNKMRALLTAYKQNKEV